MDIIFIEANQIVYRLENMPHDTQFPERGDTFCYGDMLYTVDHREFKLDPFKIYKGAVRSYTSIMVVLTKKSK